MFGIRTRKKMVPIYRSVLFQMFMFGSVFFPNIRVRIKILHLKHFSTLGDFWGDANKIVNNNNCTKLNKNIYFPAPH